MDSEEDLGEGTVATLTRPTEVPEVKNVAEGNQRSYEIEQVTYGLSERNKGFVTTIYEQALRQGLSQGDAIELARKAVGQLTPSIRDQNSASVAAQEEQFYTEDERRSLETNFKTREIGILSKLSDRRVIVLHVGTTEQDLEVLMQFINEHPSELKQRFILGANLLLNPDSLRSLFGDDRGNSILRAINRLGYGSSVQDLTPEEIKLKADVSTSLKQNADFASRVKDAAAKAPGRQLLAINFSDPGKEPWLDAQLNYQVTEKFGGDVDFVKLPDINEAKKQIEQARTLVSARPNSQKAA